ncbi:MAG: hypothetical protein ACUVSK_13535 [Desulfotomaculales bacterium]
MSRIVLYKGQSQYDVLLFFMDFLADSFSRMGKEVFVVDLLVNDAGEQLKQAFSVP